MNVTEVFVVKVLIPRSPLTRLNVEKQGEGRDDLMTMEIILPMRMLVMTIVDDDNDHDDADMMRLTVVTC